MTSNEDSVTKGGRGGSPAPPGPPTPLIYLDVDDEITSAAARIRASDAEAVALVLPYGSRLATSRINFRLLAREAAERGKQIEVVTADASARSLAGAAGLRVYPSVAAYEGRSGPDGGNGKAAGAAAAADADGAAERGLPGDDSSATGLWATAHPLAPGAAGVPVGGQDVDDAPTSVIAVPRKKSAPLPRVGPPRPPVRTGLAVGVGLAAVMVVAVAGLLALELLPSATIELAPRAEPIRPISLVIEARTDVTSVDEANLLIPAQEVQFDLTAETTITATGTKLIETKATGNVTFSNLDPFGSKRIEAGSIVRTKAKKIEFAVLADVSLPPASIDFSNPFEPVLIPSTSTVGVEAVEPGPDGNVNNNTITVVPPDESRDSLQVTNSDPTSGGDRTEAPEISQEDVDAALETLAGALRADLDAQIAGNTGIPAGATVFPETAAVEPGELSVDPATLVGSPELEVEVSQVGTGSVVAVDQAPIDAIARTRLEAEVAEGWRLDPDSVQLTPGTPTPHAGGATYPLTMSGTMVRDVDVAALVESIRGLGVAEARTRLEAFGDVRIDTWPDWVTTIPGNGERITLTVGEPAPASPAP